MIRKMDIMNKRNNLLVFLVILFGGILVYLDSSVAQQESSPSMFGNGTVELAGMRVPDIGPLPTVVPTPHSNFPIKPFLLVLW